MASTSIQNSPLSPWIWKYDVFLNFRGEDTRNSFVDHLFAALHRKAIITFKDDVKLRKGKAISEELPKAIEESQICIVIFSKNYASSTWCLRELAKIVDCNEQVDRNQTILPVFYDVDPSEVKKQTGSYQEAFARHEITFPNSDKVQRWRTALSKVAVLSGWDVRNKSESQVIEDIVKVTTSVLGHKFLSLDDELVGIQSRLEILNMHLALGLNDVRYIGIVGMGGIGKTTLATVLYDRIHHYFDASSFLENVNKGSDDGGLIDLQKQLLCETLQEENVKIWSLHTGTNLISSRLRNTKSLIILDNVEQSYQLEKLVGKLEWFGAGSRIIITTRDEHILKEYGVDHVYKVELLNNVEDLELFCSKAFKCDHPLRDYEGLTSKVLEYVNGLPLAIKVLGSYLCSRSVSEWKCVLVRLQGNPKKEIMDVLRTSFDGLEATEKEMFLDISCFLQRWNKRDAKRMLDIRGFQAEIGMRILIDKSLINIEDGKIWMHDMLKELGRKIVMEKSPNEPGRWSRLWSYEHLHHIMMRNSATEDIEVLALSGPHPKEMKLKAETLSKMSRLRILSLDGMEISGNLNDFSNEIRYFRWHNYPYTYLPHPFTRSSSIFQVLVELILPHCSSKQLWEGIKPLNSLRFLDISHSKNLIKMPDCRGMPKLKWLFLEGCTSLTHVDESIGVLSKLKTLSLSNCRSLVSLPNSIFHLTSLVNLYLDFCSKLQNLSEKTSGAERLKEFTKKPRFTSSIVTRRHKQPSELLLHDLRRLVSLCLGFCNLRELPDTIECMQSLEVLDLKGNKFVTLPSTITKLSRLAFLNLGECKELRCLPELPLSTHTNFSGGNLAPIRGSYLGRLSIFNCPKLDENKIQPYTKLAFSWLTKLVQDPRYPDGRIDIVIPGSNVSEWFNHQSLGRLIRVQLPQNRNWIGVALCVALVPNRYDNIDHSDTTTYYHTSFTVKLCGGKMTRQIPTPRLLMRDLVAVKSDHLWLLYLPREMSICRTLLRWQVGNDVEFRASGKDIKVTKCGVRWVQKQDIQELELLKATFYEQ